MNLIINDIQSFLSTSKEPREKNSFWCSETETPLFDIYHKWKGTLPTSPISAEKILMMNTGKMVEMSLIETMESIGLLKEVEDGGQFRVEMERCGVKITGYMDAVLKTGEPIEVKSFYGDYQTKEIKDGKPKTSYLKQLACYMDFLNAKIGRLVYIHRGTGEFFEFILERTEGLKFKCLDIEFDLEDTYKRWAKLYKENIEPGIEPKSEYRYKIPVKEIDWSKVSKTDISKARNNQKVIGDGWQVQYSPYKELIIEREGTCLGYTDEELDYIKKVTAGYSSKK